MSLSNEDVKVLTSLSRRVLLGLYLIPSPQGVMIQNIDPSSPVSKTTLQIGDCLKSINGQTITDPTVLLFQQREIKEGEEVCLKVDQKGQEIEVSFIPGLVPFEKPAKENINEYNDFSIEGICFRSIFTYSKDLKKEKQNLPAILLLPGLGGVPCDQPGVVNLLWDISQRLAQKGALVMRFDQRGSGDSQGDLYGNIDFFTEIADAQKALEILSSHPLSNQKDLRLVGISLGGIVAPLIAKGDPRVRHITLWGGTARPWVNYALENVLIQAKLRKAPKEQLMKIHNLSCLLWGLLSATDMEGEDLLKGFPILRELGLNEKYYNVKILAFWRQLARLNIAEVYEQGVFRLLALRGEFDALSSSGDLQSILKAAEEAGLKAEGKKIFGVDHFCNKGNSMKDCFMRVLQGRIIYEPQHLLTLLS